MYAFRSLLASTVILALAAPATVLAQPPNKKELPDWREPLRIEPIPPAPAKPWRGLLISGAVCTGIGIVGLGLMIAGLSVAATAGGRLADLSTNQTTSGFPRGDYACRSGEPNECPPTLENRMRVGNTMAYAGGMIGVPFLPVGVPMLAVGVSRRRYAASLLTLRGGPTLWPRGGGLTLTLAF